MWQCSTTLRIGKLTRQNTACSSYQNYYWYQDDSIDPKTSCDSEAQQFTIHGEYATTNPALRTRALGNKVMCKLAPPSSTVPVWRKGRNASAYLEESSKWSQKRWIYTPYTSLRWSPLSYDLLELDGSLSHTLLRRVWLRLHSVASYMY